MAPTASTIPAHWPTEEARAAAARTYGVGAGRAAPAAGTLAAAFPPKHLVATGPSPEDAAADPAAVAALQAEVRRALAGVGVRVPLYGARRGGRGGGPQQQEAAAVAPPPAPTPTRRLTALEAALEGMGLRTPRGRRGA